MQKKKQRDVGINAGGRPVRGSGSGSGSVNVGIIKFVTGLIDSVADITSDLRPR